MPARHQRIAIEQLEREPETDRLWPGVQPPPVAVAKLLAMFLRNALQHGADTIVVEPFEERTTVTFRSGAAVVDQVMPPHKLRGLIVSGLARLAGIDPELPSRLEGSFSLEQENQIDLDVLVKLEPSVWGNGLKLELLLNARRTLH